MLDLDFIMDIYPMIKKNEFLNNQYQFFFFKYCFSGRGKP